MIFHLELSYLKLLNLLCLKTYSLFQKSEPNLLSLSAPFYIFGDIQL